MADDVDDVDADQCPARLAGHGDACHRLRGHAGDHHNVATGRHWPDIEIVFELAVTLTAIRKASGADPGGDLVAHVAALVAERDRLTHELAAAPRWDVTAAAELRARREADPGGAYLRGPVVAAAERDGLRIALEVVAYNTRESTLYEVAAHVRAEAARLERDMLAGPNRHRDRYRLAIGAMERLAYGIKEDDMEPNAADAALAAAKGGDRG